MAVVETNKQELGLTNFCLLLIRLNTHNKKIYNFNNVLPTYKKLINFSETKNLLCLIWNIRVVRKNFEKKLFEYKFIG